MTRAFIELKEAELEKLIEFSADVHECVSCTWPANKLRTSRTGPQTLAYLADLRGISVEDLLSADEAPAASL